MAASPRENAPNGGASGSRAKKDGARTGSAETVEFPRGEIDIIAPGQDPFGGARRRSPFGFEGASAQRTYTFQTRLSGFLGLVFAVIIASALFVFLASFVTVVVILAVAIVAGFVLRNTLRRWMGR
ncbi:MAG: hypothetical protein ACK5JM_03455 [Rhodoblastus sp.]